MIGWLAADVAATLGSACEEYGLAQAGLAGTRGQAWKSWLGNWHATWNGCSADPIECLRDLFEKKDDRVLVYGTDGGNRSNQQMKSIG